MTSTRSCATSSSTKRDNKDTIDVGEVEKIGDADAVPLTGRDEQEAITVWVAVEAPHRVLKVAPPDDHGLPDALYFEASTSHVMAEILRTRRTSSPIPGA